MKSFPFREKYAILHFLWCTTSNSDCFRVSLQDFYLDDFFLSPTLSHQLLHNSLLFKRDICLNISIEILSHQFDPFLPISGFKSDTLSISWASKRRKTSVISAIRVCSVVRQSKYWTINSVSSLCHVFVFLGSGHVSDLGHSYPAGCCTHWILKIQHNISFFNHIWWNL